MSTALRSGDQHCTECLASRTGGGFEGQRNTFPPPCNPPPLQSPPPQGGDRHLAPKTLGAENFFSLGYTGTGVGGDRHLVTVPPPPHGGDRPDLRGGDYRGGGGYLQWASHFWLSIRIFIFPRGIFLWFWVGGWFGLVGGVRQMPLPPLWMSTSMLDTPRRQGRCSQIDFSHNRKTSRWHRTDVAQPHVPSPRRPPHGPCVPWNAGGVHGLPTAGEAQLEGHRHVVLLRQYPWVPEEEMACVCAPRMPICLSVAVAMAGSGTCPRAAPTAPVPSTS